MYFAMLDKILPQLNGFKSEILIVLGIVCFVFNMVLTMLKIPVIPQVNAAGGACLVAAIATLQNRGVRTQTQIDDLKSQIPSANDSK
jgi:hypothetical protein